MRPTLTVIHAHYGRGGGSIEWSDGSRTTGIYGGPAEILERCASGVAYPGTSSEHAVKVGAGAVLIDTSTIPDDVIGGFSIYGPMVKAALPAGTVARLGVGVVPWQWEGPYGADGFDYVAADVAVRIARRFGATVIELDPEAGCGGCDAPAGEIINGRCDGCRHGAALEQMEMEVS